MFELSFSAVKSVVDVIRRILFYNAFEITSVQTFNSYCVCSRGVCIAMRFVRQVLSITVAYVRTVAYVLLAKIGAKIYKLHDTILSSNKIR